MHQIFMIDLFSLIMPALFVFALKDLSALANDSYKTPLGVGSFNGEEISQRWFSIWIVLMEQQN